MASLRCRLGWSLWVLPLNKRQSDPWNSRPALSLREYPPESGLLAGVSDRNAVFEIFRAGNLPDQDFSDPTEQFYEQQEMVPGEEEPEPLF